MQRLGGIRILAAGLVMLAGLSICTPAVPVFAAARPSAQPLSPAGVALRKQIMQRYPQAAVTINRITGTPFYAVYVMLANQKGATLSGGNGAVVLAWYIHAYPKQTVYVLSSGEQSAGKINLWEYDFRPASNRLQRYHFTFNPPHNYPWTSWHISTQGILQAARLAQWPKNGVQHAQAALPASRK